MALAAGRLRHQVQLQKPETTQDPNTGEMLVTWTTIATPFAAVEPVSASAFIAAAAAQSEAKGQIIIRKRSDIDATMRFVHRGLAYKILGILADKDTGVEYLTCPVSEGVKVD